MMEAFKQDVRYALRMLVKNPIFTVVVVITLALGIGANTAIFSAVNAVLLRPFGYEDPDQLVYVWETELSRGLNKITVSLPDFKDWREQNQIFTEMSAYLDTKFNLLAGSEPEQVVGARVSANFFSMLGAKTIFGRSFLPEEEEIGKHRVVILSEGLWKRRFGSDPNVISQSLTLNGYPFTVVGVMPSDFRLPRPDVEMWLPMTFRSTDRTDHFLSVIARLKPGISVHKAQGEMDILANRLEEQYKENKGVGAHLVPFHEEVFGSIRLALQVLLGAVIFVLLIACANVTNLLLARATAREKEVSLRIALGASRGRLIRQLLTESVILALVGGAFGLALAYWGTIALTKLSPTNIPRLQNISMDGRVLGFTLVITLVTGILFGLVPALRNSKPDLHMSLKEGSRSSKLGARSRQLFTIMVISEVALALVLLIGAGLVINSFLRLQLVNPGFNKERVLTMQVSLPGSVYREYPRIADFFQQLEQRVKALPEVEYVGATNSLPMYNSEDRYFMMLDAEGRSLGPSREGEPPVLLYQVTPGYFQAMGVPLMAGRVFTEADGQQAPPVVVLSDNVARRYFPDQNPIGNKVRVGSPDRWEQWMTVIGVVGDVRLNDLKQPPVLAVYTSHPQGIRLGVSLSMSLAIRTTGDPLNVANLAREQVWALDNTQPVASIKTMAQRVDETLTQPRFNMVLLALFAVVALVLATVGIYGVMSYTVTQRTHEIGIRMALGAQPADVLKLVVGHGMILALIGIAVGLAASWVLTRLMSSLLYEIKATDITTFMLISLLLAAVSFIATYIPARKATKVDPMIALRYE